MRQESFWSSLGDQFPETQIKLEPRQNTLFTYTDHSLSFFMLPVKGQTVLLNTAHMVCTVCMNVLELIFWRSCKLICMLKPVSPKLKQVGW